MVVSLTLKRTLNAKKRTERYSPTCIGCARKKANILLVFNHILQERIYVLSSVPRPRHTSVAGWRCLLATEKFSVETETGTIRIPIAESRYFSDTDRALPMR